MSKKHFIITLFLVSSSSWSYTVDDFLKQYKEKNNLYKASELAVNSAHGKVESADLELSPVLTLDYLKNNDQSLPSLLSPHRQFDQYAVGLAKNFSTGTQVKLDAKTFQFENASPVAPGFDKYSTGLLGVTVKQSLWRNFFGFGTKTKMERLRKTAQLESFSSDIQLKAQLLDAEVTFWDYVYAQEDLKSKKENLKRAQKLVSWTSRRVSNGIGDKADLLNSKSLAAIRELQVISSENDFKNIEIKLKQMLNLPLSESLPEVKINLSNSRPYIEYLSKKQNVIKYENYLSVLESDVKTLASEEVNDSLKPDLSVFGSYNYTSFDREYKNALSEMTDSKYPQSTIGVNLTWVLGGSSKSALLDSLSKDINAAELKAAKKRSDGLQAWDEYLRQYKVLTRQSQLLTQIVDIQKNRLQAENDRFEKGRSVTATVITAESDMAEAESNALKALIGLRKYEASSQLYVSMDDL